MLAVSAIALLATEAKGAVAVSNLADFLNGAFPVKFEDPVGNSRAQQFTTGTIPMYLDSVTLSMNNAGVVDAGTFHVDLFTSSASSLPDQPLVRLEGTTAPSATSLYTYTPPAPLQLAASTTYWIVASVDDVAPNKFYNWEFTASSAVNGLTGWSMGPSSLGTSFFGSAVSWSPQSVPLKMEIAATPAPEPIAWGSVLLGAGVLSFCRGRRVLRDGWRAIAR